MLKAQSGVDMPSKSFPTRKRYPFDTMEVGEMFFVEDRASESIWPQTSAAGTRLGRKFAARAVTMLKNDGEWVLCEPDDEGAVEGVGVWRTE